MSDHPLPPGTPVIVTGYDVWEAPELVARRAPVGAANLADAIDAIRPFAGEGGDDAE